MSTARLDFRAHNNADWHRAFSLTSGTTGVPPWASVAAWSAVTQYASTAPASVVTYAGDLYVAKAGTTPTLGFFSASQWSLVGVASLFTAEPRDLTGFDLKMQLAAVANDSVNVGEPTLTLTLGNGLTITSASQGGVEIFVPVERARGVRGGRYAYDMIATKGGRQERVLAGFVSSEEGVTR